MPPNKQIIHSKFGQQQIMPLGKVECLVGIMKDAVINKRSVKIIDETYPGGRFIFQVLLLLRLVKHEPDIMQIFRLI